MGCAGAGAGLLSGCTGSVCACSCATRDDARWRCQARRGMQGEQMSEYYLPSLQNLEDAISMQACSTSPTQLIHRSIAMPLLLAGADALLASAMQHLLVSWRPSQRCSQLCSLHSP